MKCWVCGALIEMPLNGKISFRATCEKCNADLHCCKNCKFYKVGKPNDCLIPGTEFIADREKNNYCEDFSMLGIGPTPKDDESKKKFNDLFW
jgi:hypothetical protein